MGTLASELAAHADRIAERPRLYADANVPAGLVTFMRERLHWDVFSVVEDADLRRAPDLRHYRLARQWRRTLVTLDRDYLDDRRFPPAESGGVLVLWAPDDRGYRRLLRRLDAVFFRPPAASEVGPAGADFEPRTTDPGRQPTAQLPLIGRKLHIQTDWQPE
jgi:hypothetical protein